MLLSVCDFSKFLPLYCNDIRVHQEAKGVNDNCDVVVDLFESIEHLMKRLNLYTLVPRAASSTMDEIAVKIMMELISALALATKDVKQGRSSESVVADILRYSTQRREVWKKTFRRKGHRGGPTKARSGAH